MTKTPATKFEQTHIAMVLDRSGSMSSCRAATIAAVNKYLLEARQDTNLKEADFDLLTFDSESIETARSGAPIKITDLTEEDFVPRASTPLYDAIGRGIDGLDGKLTASGSTKAILVVITDGQENASRKHTHGSISELIKARQDKGWLVVFLGAGLGSAQQGISLGVMAAHTANIATDAASLSSVGETVYSMNAGYARNVNAESAKRWVASGASAMSMSARKSMGDKSAGGGILNKLPSQAKRAAPPPPAQKGDTWEKPDSNDAWSQ